MTENLSNIWVTKDFWRRFPPRVNTSLSSCIYVCSFGLFACLLLRILLFFGVCVCVTLFTLIFIWIINKYTSCHTCKPTASRAFRPTSCHSFWCVCIFPSRSPASCLKGSFRSLSRSHPLTSFSSVPLSIFLVLYKHIIFITVIRLDLRRQSDHRPWNQRP